jgi:DNA recombination protein RmuC
VDSLHIALLVVIVVLTATVVAVALRGGGDVSRALGELQRRVDALVSQLPQSVADGTAQQARSLADVREQMVRLSEAAARLETIGASVAAVEELLQVPQLRGTLGEVWLEELLRQVFPEGLYQTQYAFRSGERVDAVLRVGPRLVPIDAKFPLEACRRMLAAEGNAADRERRAFRRSLRERVDEIADKYIRPAEGTFEFALMYIPAENVYYEAVVRGEEVERDESVIGYALGRRVIPVSPNTLYAYLAAVLHGLRGLEVEERAREILAALGEVEQEVERIERAVEVGGKHFENASRQFDDAGYHLTRLRQQLEALRRIGGSDGSDERDGNGS